MDAVASRRSFAAAAEEPHRVPLAASYTINKLEEDLDVALFDCSRRKAELAADLARCLTVLAEFKMQTPANVTPDGLLARCRDEQWWRRRLRRALGQATEDIGRHLGIVHKRRALYVTDLGARRHTQQQRQNQESLAGLVAINDDGD